MSQWQVAFCLFCALSGSSSAHCLAADSVEIRREISRLTSEVSERLKQIAALRMKLDSANPPRGLEGYCPVTLVNDEQWVMGSPDHSVTFEGCDYFFADAQRRKEFQQSPQKYTPTMGGHDPVIWLEKGERVMGRRKHGVFYAGKIVLFASEESLARFSDAPRRYAIGESGSPSQETSVEPARGGAEVGGSVAHRHRPATKTRRGRCLRERSRRR